MVQWALQHVRCTESHLPKLYRPRKLEHDGLSHTVCRVSRAHGLVRKVLLVSRSPPYIGVWSDLGVAVLGYGCT
jgi:hypothetical protein